MFLLPFWKLTCKYLLVNFIFFLKKGFVVSFGFGFGFFCMRSRRRWRGEGNEGVVHRGHVTASFNMALFTGIKDVYFHRNHRVCLRPCSFPRNWTQHESLFVELYCIFFFKEHTTLFSFKKRTKSIEVRVLKWRKELRSAPPTAHVNWLGQHTGWCVALRDRATSSFILVLTSCAGGMSGPPSTPWSQQYTHP